MNTGSNEIDVKFTGEFFIPKLAGDRIEADHMERYRFAAKYAKGKSVLDIACGYGYGGQIFSEAGCTFYEGVDINKALVENASKVFGSDRVNYLYGDAGSFVSEMKYDLVVSFETIEHISSYRAALDRMYENLAPGGTLIISSPNRPVTSPSAKNISDKPLNKFHTQEFTVQELSLEIKRSGFDTDSMKVFGQRLSLFHFRNRFARKVTRILGLDPADNASPTLCEYKLKTPRYFVIVVQNAKS